jgi:hypothetical protein
MIFDSKIAFYTYVLDNSIFWLIVGARNVQFYRLILTLL